MKRKNVKEFRTNLFCSLISKRKRFIFNFGDSKAVFLNRGKDVFLKSPRGISDYPDTNFVVRDEKTNIYELLILSEDFENSFNVVDLIKSSSTIIQSEKKFDLESLKNALLLSWDKPIDPPNMFKALSVGYSYSCSPDLFYATQMASDAFGSAQKENAIFKYDMARDLININPLSLSPFNDCSNRIYYHSEQLRFGYSIIACYSILEELNLEIKSNKEKPSTINNGSVWNDSVLKDLKRRLNDSGINTNETIPWIVRNKLKRPFKAVVKSSELCEWSNGDDVRDFNISMCDAIIELSYIRDCIASHGVRERVYELTVYDTENAYAALRKILFLYFFHEDKKFFRWYSGF